jgi:two-component system NtrC family sensor kinase
MTWFLLALGAVVLATVGGVGWWLARRVLRPVQALQQAAVRLGAGELTTPIPHSQADELGDLAATLRTMAARLRDSQAELAARVEQRSREVLRSARLAQLGTLAAGIAHEVNNPLASIVAGAEGLLREIDGTAPVDRASLRDYLQILHKEALRVRDITARLLRFARQPEPRREPVQLAAEAREVAALFAHQMQAAGVHFELVAEGDGPRFVGDAAEWRQVLFNLLRNALDASPRGGAVRVLLHEGDGEIRLVVTDDGPGVAAGSEDRIFEPFFTTKDPGKGTGLGLAIVHRIVDAHAGRIEVGNGAHGARGACFTITLPRSA